MATFQLDTGSSIVKVKVDYTIDQDTAKNQSTIKVDLYFVNTASSNSWNETGNAYYNIGIGSGRKGNTNFSFNLRNKSAWTQTYIGSYSYTVSHDSSGQATVPIWVYINSGVSIGTINQTRRVTLPRIASQGTISVSDQALSNAGIEYTIGNMMDGFKYTVWIVVGDGFGKTLTYTGTGSKTYSWSLLNYDTNKILEGSPTSNRVPITIQLTTLDGSGNVVGTNTASAQIIIDDAYAPTVGSHTLSRLGTSGGKNYENLTTFRFAIGESSSGTKNTPKAKGGAKLEKVQVVNRINGRVLTSLTRTQMERLEEGEPINVDLTLNAGDYLFSVNITDSRGLTTTSNWSSTYVVHPYELPQIVTFGTERDGNSINLNASIEPGTDPMKYQVILNGNGYVHDSQIVVPLDKYNDGYVKDSFNGYFNSSGTYTSVKEDDSFEVELRIYYGTSDYVSARGSVGTADIPLSLGKFGAGVGTLVDDNGAHLQVGEKGLASGGGGTFNGMVEIDLDYQTKMELKGTSSNGSLMRFIIDGKRSGWIGSWGNDLQVTSPTNDRLVLSSDQITYRGNPLGYSSGNNINGDWIKFNDGTAICYGRVTTTYNQPWVTMADWYYPIKFNKRPIVIATVSQGSGSGLIATIDDSRTNNLFADVKVTQKEDSINFTSTKTHDAQVIAIGRWK